MDFQHTLKIVLACRLQRAAVWSSSFSFEPKHQVSFACYCQLMLPCVIWHPITTARPGVVHICLLIAQQVVVQIRMTYFVQ